MRNLAATWIGGGRTLAEAPPLPCGAAEQVTVMQQGAVLEGRFRSFDEQGLERDPTLALLHAYPNGLRCTALGIYDGAGEVGDIPCALFTVADGRYRFAGLSTGRYVLHTGTRSMSVDLIAGRTTTVDWYECAAGCPETGPSEGD